ncbi:PCNA-interacting partner [Protopterus annectens]|uniref:PCNA-interacting partner n=1 Tax=Protopterus annectens TaxID=7888 RepID=UPI001CFA5F85|nr:PCNA-interacting partner [Protopterus annectens]
MELLQKNILDLVRIFRRECRKRSEYERTTLYGANDMLLGLQLCMAEVNKKDFGDFTVSLSDLMETWKYLLHEKLHLISEDESMPEKYTDIKHCYDTLLNKSNALDLIDVYFKCVKKSPEFETGKLISKEQLLEFILGPPVCLDDDPLPPVIPSTPSRAKVHMKSKVRKILTSSLAVIVFLILAATSFIRALELGGKGYAPLDSDPLRKHIKGLCDFVRFTDKLEEILGEIPDPCVAGNRILSAIKMRLLKGRSSGDLFSVAVEEVVQELDVRIKNIINAQRKDAHVSSTDMSPARPKSYAINHCTAYCGRETVKTFLNLLDEEATSLPSRNKADLLYGDDSALVYGVDHILTLFRSPEQSSDSSPKSLRQRVQKRISEGKAKVKQTLIRSQFACTYREDMVPVQSTTVVDFDEHHHPTEILDPSVRQPILGTYFGNVQQKGNANKGSGGESSMPETKCLKRKQVELNTDNAICGNENEPPQKKVIAGSKTSKRPQNKLDSRPASGKSSKATAKNKLIAGQAKLTNFFRV